MRFANKSKSSTSKSSEKKEEVAPVVEEKVEEVKVEASDFLKFKKPSVLLMVFFINKKGVLWP